MSYEVILAPRARRDHRKIEGKLLARIEVDDDRKLVKIARIVHRREAYRRL